MRDENLILRKHGDDELKYYSKDGLGTYDIEYAYPFSDGYGELEGIAHRGNFDSEPAPRPTAAPRWSTLTRRPGSALSPTSSSPPPG